MILTMSFTPIEISLSFKTLSKIVLFVSWKAIEESFDIFKSKEKAVEAIAIGNNREKLIRKKEDIEQASYA